MVLRLESARHAIHDGYPCHEVGIEGQPCLLIREAKQPFVDAGLVHVGEDFADVCPLVTIRPYGGEPQTFESFSADPRLFALWSRFAEAEDLEPGLVAIPG